MQTLNPQQQAAVTEIDCPPLVLAGAGNGKARMFAEKGLVSSDFFYPCSVMKILVPVQK
ncbi:MAG: hypothetical protein ACRER2_16720 [Methylococcales bacterium]